jgi:hypothetical protein
LAELTEFEKKAYDFIKEQGELQIYNMPKQMWGAIPNLKNARLIKTYKKVTTHWHQRKRIH